jgi:hypothetical protein
MLVGSGPSCVFCGGDYGEHERTCPELALRENVGNIVVHAEIAALKQQHAACEDKLTREIARLEALVESLTAAASGEEARLIAFRERCAEVSRLEAALHMAEAHPDWEYRRGALFQDSELVEHGWEENRTSGGYYWRRRKAT